MRGRLDDEQLITERHHTAWLGEVASDRRDGAGVGIEPADRTVVGVGDRHRTVGQHAAVERMLQQRLGRRTVDVTEVEQPAAHLGGDNVVGDATQSRRLGVREPQRSSVRRHRESRWLCEPSLHEVAVDEALLRRASAHGEASGDGVVAPELMVACHRDGYL